MSENLENPAVATGLEKVNYHSKNDNDCQRKAMPWNVQTTMQLCSFHMLESLYSKSFKLSFSSAKNF